MAKQTAKKTAGATKAKATATKTQSQKKTQAQTKTQAMTPKSAHKNPVRNLVEKSKDAQASLKERESEAAQRIEEKLPNAPRKVMVGSHAIETSSFIYSILLIVAAIFIMPLCGNIMWRAILDFTHGSAYAANLAISIGVLLVEAICMVVFSVGAIWLAVRMLKGITYWRLHITEGLMVDLTVLILAHMMLFGISTPLIFFDLLVLLLIAMHSSFDPQLALERANEETTTQTLKQMLHSNSERTYIPGKSAGRGYITLNFFNLFWIFVIASILGLIIETIYHAIVFGGYQDRAGILWGPFSPIYGFGAVLMTIALNHFHSKPVWLIFFVSALVGGTFEFCTSYFMEYAFGITAWNYSGTFLSIGGRTNFMFMCFWGLLGVVWIKLLLPIMFYFVKKIPWGVRYTLTTVCAVLLLFDGLATLVTIDCWYMREAGDPVTTQVEKFCARHYDNEYMQNRFQTMTMDPANATRTRNSL